MIDESIELRNRATRLVDEERQRWYAALEPLLEPMKLEGLAPEVVADHLKARIFERFAKERVDDAIDAYNRANASR